MRLILAKTKHFRDQDIILKWTLVYYISPHQYLQVKIGNEWTDVDLRGARFGIKLGEHAVGFNIL